MYQITQTQTYNDRNENGICSYINIYIYACQKSDLCVASLGAICQKMWHSTCINITGAHAYIIHTPTPSLTLFHTPSHTNTHTHTHTHTPQRSRVFAFCVYVHRKNNNAKCLRMCCLPTAASNNTLIMHICTYTHTYTDTHTHTHIHTYTHIYTVMGYLLGKGKYDDTKELGEIILLLGRNRSLYVLSSRVESWII